MLKTTVFATLAFSGVHALDLSSSAQIEVGSFAMNGCNVARLSRTLASYGYSENCAHSDQGAVEQAKRKLLCTGEFYYQVFVQLFQNEQTES